MPQIVRWSSFAALALLVVACRPEKTATQTLSTDYQVDPKVLTFAACPSTDEGGDPVQDVFPDEKILTLENRGRTEGRIELSVTGEDAANFLLVPEETPKEVGPNAKVKFPVRFNPTKAGPHQATLVVDDGDPAGKPTLVDLAGTGRDLPAQPKLMVEVQSKDDPAVFNQCSAGLICMPTFADTFFGQSSTLQIKLRNEGCPALRITGARLEKYALDSDNLAFYLDEPAVPPTSAAPMVLTATGGAEQTTLVVRFSPEEDSTGNSGRYAQLTLTTNDPANPEFSFTLFGNGVKPSLAISPVSCDFSDTNQSCGNSPRVEGEARFAVTNVGTASLSVESVTFEKGGQGRFTVVQNVQGATLAPNQQSTLLVKHLTDALYVTDRVLVNAGAAGNVILQVAGGSPPQMVTDPELRLDFANPTTSVTERPLVIRNSSTTGALVINRVYIDANNYFSLVAPVTAGTRLNPGESTTVQVRYTKPVAGGQQIGVLHVESNDPRFSAPAHKVVTLFSESPPDLPPTAVLTACLPKDLGTNPTCTGGATEGLSVVLAQLTAPRQVTISGIDSVDPTATGGKAVAEYEFRLVRQPSTGATLENNGVRTTKPTAVLTLNPTATGEYRLMLRTYDDQGQASPAWANLSVFTQ